MSTQGQIFDMELFHSSLYLSLIALPCVFFLRLIYFVFESFTLYFVVFFVSLYKIFLDLIPLCSSTSLFCTRIREIVMCLRRSPFPSSYTRALTSCFTYIFSFHFFFKQTELYDVFLYDVIKFPFPFQFFMKKRTPTNNVCL